MCVIHTRQNKKQEAARHAELVNERVSVSLCGLSEVSVPGSKVRKRAAHLAHHQGAVLGAVSIRVVVAVVVTSHHAEGLVGTLTRGWPEREKLHDIHLLFIQSRAASHAL